MYFNKRLSSTEHGSNGFEVCWSEIVTVTAGIKVKHTHNQARKLGYRVSYMHAYILLIAITSS